MYTYDQKLGLFIKSNGDDLCLCYSGNGKGLNNPQLQNVHNVGPISKGYWIIKAAITHPRLGPIAMPLFPCDANGGLIFLLNKRTGFYIHGDNSSVNHSASDGCIVMGHDFRTWLSGNLASDCYLEVL